MATLVVLKRSVHTLVVLKRSVHTLVQVTMEQEMRTGAFKSQLEKDLERQQTFLDKMRAENK